VHEQRAGVIFLSLLGLLILSGCNQQSDGFNLPRGDAEQGKATFILLQCTDCHSVEGIPWAGTDTSLNGPGATTDAINVTLGGTVTRIKTYGDLVTSIINPSHKLAKTDSPGTTTPEGKSTMRLYNDVMSVQELIDLVEFLQSKYEVHVPDYYTYGI